MEARSPCVYVVLSTCSPQPASEPGQPTAFDPAQTADMHILQAVCSP